MTSETLSQSTAEAHDRLRQHTLAMRLSFRWFGTRKSVGHDQKDQLARSVDATGDYLSVGKKLIDTTHPTYKAVSRIRSQAISFWKGISLPFPEPGIRLIKQSDLELATQRMEELRDDLQLAVEDLDRHFDELKAQAQVRLGRLYNSADYPDSLTDLFELSWDFPSCEPPPYLQQLSPQLYEQECQRARDRFEEAIRMSEEAFAGELSKLIEHLLERLSGQTDGKPKIFRDSVIDNLSDFFGRFRRLNVRSNPELDQLVERAQQVLGGVEPQTLRDRVDVRQQVSSQLASVQSVLDGWMIDRPRRSLIRRAR